MSDVIHSQYVFYDLMHVKIAVLSQPSTENNVYLYSEFFAYL